MVLAPRFFAGHSAKSIGLPLLGNCWVVKPRFLNAASSQSVFFWMSGGLMASFGMERSSRYSRKVPCASFCAAYGESGCCAQTLAAAKIRTMANERRMVVSLESHQSRDLSRVGKLFQPKHHITQFAHALWRQGVGGELFEFCDDLGGAGEVFVAAARGVRAAR